MKTKPAIRCGSGVRSCSGNTELSYRLPQGPGLASLRKDMWDGEVEIRFYYIDSVDWKDETGRKPGLYQSGCGLNLRGIYATLCTCKRKMLDIIHKTTRKAPNRPIYIAVLGDTKGRRPNTKDVTPMVFLGKVERSFESFLDIWMYLPRRARHAKDVRLNALGDLYSPTLVRSFQKTGRIASSRFAEGFVHAGQVYKKDLRESFPVVFKEWRAWADGNVGFGRANLKGLRLPNTFRAMIEKPRPSAYGWKYRLSELRPLIRRLKLDRKR
jgi:hypothetical protein